MDLVKTKVKNPELIRRRQEQICRGAMKVFGKKGFHAASMREIANASKISLGSMYDYIEKKEDILFLLHRDFLSRIYRRFDECIERYDTAIEQLLNVIRELFGLTVQLRDQALFIYTETKSLERQYLHRILRNESEFVSKIEGLITNGVNEGVFACKNPSVLANIIAYSFAIVPLRGWNLFPKNSEAEVLNELIEIFSGRLRMESLS